MGLAISEEHLELERAVARWAEATCDRSVVREPLDRDADGLPGFWDELAGLGWLGLHLPETCGGEGFGLLEVGIVLEVLARAGAPGPMLPTVVASALIATGGDDEVRDRWLPGFADGSLVGAFGDPGAGPVLGAGLADVLVLVEDGQLVVRERADVEVHPRSSVDPTRRVASVEVRAGAEPAAVLDARAASVVAGLVGADAVGAAAWCVDTAAEHARTRVQFGRPIGQFQAVKHRCAGMLLRLELARAAVWDALRADDADQRELAAAVCAAIAPAACFDIAKDCIQVLGGIGYTWEHDAHLYLRRATVTHQLFAGEPARVAELAASGQRRSLAVELPPEAEPHRAEVRAFVDALRAVDKSEWNARLAEAGYLVPYWPRPWGRDASPIEQLVIDEELAAAGIRRPHLQVGAWVLPTLIAHGTEEQQERWIPPTLRGEISWCQMFSEPGAGSDLASLTTKATRVEGGWSITGQKVWTTLAHVADWAICLARTDPEAPKHEGITCFIVDMKTPGIDVRPLRELTGAALFNEVFLDDVFVPDDCVVGGVNQGWEAARTTLANERVSMGSGSSFGPGVESVLQLFIQSGGERHATEVGEAVAEGHAVAVLGLRSTLRALSGAGSPALRRSGAGSPALRRSGAGSPGAESSVRKLLGVEHEQRVQEVGLALLGAEAAADDGAAAAWIGGFLGNRALSIAGGTSDVQRNIIAERLLDLPKDP